MFQHSDLAQALCTKTVRIHHYSFIFYVNFVKLLLNNQYIQLVDREDRYYLWTLDIIVYTNLGPWRLNFPELENKLNWEWE